MFLLITTLKQQACQQDFMCQIKSLEEAFHFLDTIVNMGDALIDARITDQGSVLRLPVEAFDGQPVCEPISSLKQEWERILEQPLRQTVLNSVDDELHQRWLRARQKKESNLCRMLDATQYLQKTAQTSMPEGERKRRIMTFYQSIIDRNTNSLNKMQAQVLAR